ncbi:MAG: hypothetical protein RL660_3177 [Bacteroidota bacterium]|jgi:hypothetical protein
MKKFLFSFLITLASFTASNCQVLSDSFFVGTWKVIGVDILEKPVSKEDQQQVNKSKKALLNAKFIFAANKKFEFSTNVADLSIKNEYWIYDDRKQVLRVVSNIKDLTSDAASTTDINVAQKDNRVFFTMEQFVVFEVERVR